MLKHTSLASTAVLCSLFINVSCSETPIAPEPVAKAKQGVGCGTPLDATYCANLKASGEVNVRCPFTIPDGNGGTTEVFADPNDTCDDTAAFKAAIDEAHTFATVVAPGGTNGYYLSEAINTPLPLKMRGDAAEPVKLILTASLPAAAAECDHINGTLDAITAGQCRAGAFLSASVRLTLHNFKLELGDNADIGIALDGAHDSSIEDVVVNQGRRVGILVDNSLGSTFNRVTLFSNRDGMIINNSALSNLRGVSSTQNARHGIVVSRRTSSIALSAVRFENVATNSNGQDHALEGFGVFVTDAIGNITLQNVKSYYDYWGGIRVESSDNVQILNSHVITAKRADHPTYAGESANHGISLDACRHCAVIGNAITGASEAEDIWVSGDSRYLEVSHNILQTETLGPLDHNGQAFQVKFDNGSSVVGMSQHLRSNFRASAPPASGVGSWRLGDVIWNSAAVATGQDLGWMCTQVNGPYSYDCSNWRSIGVLQ